MQGNRELLVLLPLFGSIKLTGRNLFILPHLSEISFTCRLVGSPGKAAGRSDTASTTWMSPPTFLRYIGIIPGINDSTAWGQEEDVSISHDVAVQASKL